MERAKTEAVSGVSSQFNRRIPRNDVAGIEERDDVQLAKAAPVAVACQNCPAEKTLHKPHRPLQQFLGGTLRWSGHLFLQSRTRHDNSVKCFLAPFGDAIWITFKLFPKRAVLTTNIDQPFDVPSPLRGIKAGEIDQLHCDGTRGSVKSVCRFNNLRVSFVKFAKRNSAIQVKTGKQLVAAPVAASQRFLSCSGSTAASTSSSLEYKCRAKLPSRIELLESFANITAAESQVVGQDPA